MIEITHDMIKFTHDVIEFMHDVIEFTQDMIEFTYNVIEFTHDVIEFTHDTSRIELTQDEQDICAHTIGLMHDTKGLYKILSDRNILFTYYSKAILFYFTKKYFLQKRMT